MVDDEDKHGMDNREKASYHWAIFTEVAADQHKLEQWLDRFDSRPDDATVTVGELRYLCKLMLKVLHVTKNRERAELSHLAWIEGCEFSFDDD